MEQRSSEGVAGEWREQGVSGHVLCRASIGAASRGAPLRLPAQAPFVSFVVPLYNHLEQTQAMLESLQASLQASITKSFWWTMRPPMARGNGCSSGMHPQGHRTRTS
jgi:hypothetical protein